MGITLGGCVLNFILMVSVHSQLNDVALPKNRSSMLMGQGVNDKAFC